MSQSSEDEEVTPMSSRSTGQMSNDSVPNWLSKVRTRSGRSAGKTQTTRSGPYSRTVGGRTVHSAASDTRRLHGQCLM